MTRPRIMRVLAVALGLTLAFGTAAFAADQGAADGELGGDVLSGADGLLNEPRDFGAVCPGRTISADAGFNVALGITQAANAPGSTLSSVAGSFVEGGVTGAGVTFGTKLGVQGWPGAQIPTYPPLPTPTDAVPVSQLPKDGSLTAQIVGTAVLTPPANWNTSRSPGRVWPDGSTGAPSPIHGLIELTVANDATPNDATTDDGTDGVWNGTALWQATGLKWDQNAKTTKSPVTLDRPEAVRWSVLDGDTASCNRRPTITSVALADADCSQSSTLTVSISDPDLEIASADHEALTVSVDWNDGTPSSTSNGTSTTRAFSHTFAHAGSHTAAVTVTDQHGATDTSTATAVVRFSAGGILQPINANGSSIFKSNSTIPVKTRLTDCDGTNPSNLAPTIRVVRTSGFTPITGSEEIPLSTSAHTDGVMRFSEGQWIYNLSGKSLADPSATYHLIITVPSTGQTVEADFALKP